MWGVFFVFTEVLDEFRIRKQDEMYRNGLPRLGISLRIIDGKLQFHVSEIQAPESFSEVQCIRVGVTPVIEPALVIEPCRIHYKRIPFPLADRKAEPGGSGIFRQGPAVGENLAKLIELFLKDDRLPWRLNDFEWVARHQHPVRHTVR